MKTVQQKIVKRPAKHVRREKFVNVENNLVELAFLWALNELKTSNIPLDGACLEASALMVKWLRQKKIDASLIRRKLNDEEGHWTVWTPDGEVDPTIGAWSDRPRDSRPGVLYHVSPKSPHDNWPIDWDADIEGALAYV